MTTPNPETQGGSAKSTPELDAANPRAWAIYDSHGFYCYRHTEDEARTFCEHYNQRADDPLKPYHYGPLYAPAAVEARGDSSNPPMHPPHAVDPILSDDVCDAYGVPRGSRRSEVHDDYPTDGVAPSPEPQQEKRDA